MTLVLHVIADPQESPKMMYECCMNSTNISFCEADIAFFMELGDFSTCGADFVLKNVITLHKCHLLLAEI